MAEHETVAALAAQVGELRELAERLKTTVTQWDARLQREGIGGTFVLRTEVKKLRERGRGPVCDPGRGAGHREAETRAVRPAVGRPGPR